MSDTYGRLTLPVVVPDACLSILLDYFKAFLNANARAAWQAVCPGKLPVEATFSHHPERDGFNDNKLPALFLYREESRSFDDVAVDWRVAESGLLLLWVFPPAPQDKQRQRVAMTNAVVKLLDVAIERGRDPSYVVPLDTDRTAAEQGSVLLRYAGLLSLQLVKATSRELVIMMDDQSDARRYDAIECALRMEEQFEPDLTQYANNEADVTLVHADGDEFETATLTG